MCIYRIPAEWCGWMSKTAFLHFMQMVTHRWLPDMHLAMELHDLTIHALNTALTYKKTPKWHQKHLCPWCYVFHNLRETELLACSKLEWTDGQWPGYLESTTQLLWILSSVSTLPAPPWIVPELAGRWSRPLHKTAQTGCPTSVTCTGILHKLPLRP